MTSIFFNPLTDSLPEGKRLKLVHGKLYLEPTELRRGKNWLVRLFTRRHYNQERILQCVGGLLGERHDKCPALLQTYQTLLERGEAFNRKWAQVPSCTRFFKGKFLINAKVHERAIRKLAPFHVEAPPPEKSPSRTFPAAPEKPLTNSFDAFENDIPDFIMSDISLDKLGKEIKDFKLTGDSTEDLTNLQIFMTRLENLKNYSRATSSIEKIELLLTSKFAQVYEQLEDPIENPPPRQPIKSTASSAMATKIEFQPVETLDSDKEKIFWAKKGPDPEEDGDLTGTINFMGDDVVKPLLALLEMFFSGWPGKKEETHWTTQAKNMGLTLRKQPDSLSSESFLQLLLEGIGLKTVGDCKKMGVTTRTSLSRYFDKNRNQILQILLVKKNFTMTYPHRSEIPNEDPNAAPQYTEELKKTTLFDE